MMAMIVSFVIFHETGQLSYEPNILTDNISQVAIQVLGFNATGTISGITQVAAGTFHSIFLHSSGEVYICGDLGSILNGIYTLTKIKGPGGNGILTGITQIAGGWRFALFLKSDTQVYGIGENGGGQLGTTPYGFNFTENAKVVQTVLTGDSGSLTYTTDAASTILSGIKSIACGRNHSVFLKSSGEVLACGDNRFFQCGRPVMTIRASRMISIYDDNYVSDITNISASIYGTLMSKYL
jgi:alpha-tubulin suppressor-like RCC1 family protein